MTKIRRQFSYLVEKRANCEDHERADELIHPELHDQRVIDMSFAEVMYDGVPSIPEFVQITRIPPIPIEQSITEADQFS